MKPLGVLYYGMLGHNKARGTILFVSDIPSLQQMLPKEGQLHQACKADLQSCAAIYFV